jgi:hypothetical protein
MAPHLGLQRIMIPSAQVSSLTTGSVTLPSARGQFTESSMFWIATATATGSQSTLEFTSIPQTYTNLFIISTGRCQESTGGQGISLRFNDDSGNNYNRLLYQFERTGGGGTQSLSYGASENKIYADVMPDASYASNVWSSAVMDILQYSNASIYKTIISNMGSPFTTNQSSYQWHSTGTWMSNSAITKITLVNNTNRLFVSGTNYTLYGVA